MARKASMVKARKKQKLSTNPATIAKRKELRSILNSQTASMKEKLNAQKQLHKMNRNTARSRSFNYCTLTGRVKGCESFFGLSRHFINKLFGERYLPGVTTSSF